MFLVPCLFLCVRSLLQHIVQLHEELNIAAAQGDLSKSNWKSTSLAPHIEYFREFVTKLSNDCREATMNKQQKQQQQQGTKQAGTQDIGQSRTYMQRTESSLVSDRGSADLCGSLWVVQLGDLSAVALVFFVSSFALHLISHCFRLNS
jgi:hypothetical protein